MDEAERATWESTCFLQLSHARVTRTRSLTHRRLLGWLSVGSIEGCGWTHGMWGEIENLGKRKEGQPTYSSARAISNH
jgi:hypothetical protein